MSKFGLGRAGCLAAPLLLFPMACVDVVDGNEVPSEELRDARDFDRVTARGGLDVTIEEGDYAVSVRIDENLQQYVRTSVDGDTLTVAVDDANIRDKLPGPHVIISMPTLRDAETAGEGTLTASAFETDDAPISLELTGSGELYWSGRATDLDAILAGTGTLTMEGSAENAELFLRGAGAIEARDLVTDGADIVLDGAGSLAVTVNGVVNARAANGGSIDVYGRVTPGEIEPTSGATITTH